MFTLENLGQPFGINSLFISVCVFRSSSFIQDESSLMGLILFGKLDCVYVKARVFFSFHLVNFFFIRGQEPWAIGRLRIEPNPPPGPWEMGNTPSAFVPFSPFSLERFEHEGSEPQEANIISPSASFKIKNKNSVFICFNWIVSYLLVLFLRLKMEHTAYLT